MAKADVKIGLQKDLQALQEKHNAAQQQLKDLKGASADVWEKGKQGVEKAMGDLKKALESIKKQHCP
jgi:hypothetical protein